MSELPSDCPNDDAESNRNTGVREADELVVRTSEKVVDAGVKGESVGDVVVQGEIGGGVAADACNLRDGNLKVVPAAQPLGLRSGRKEGAWPPVDVDSA